MKAKKILANTLCTSMMIGYITPAYAMVTNETNTYEDTTQNDSKKTEVLYQKAGNYFVTIPKTISLGADKQSQYSIKVEGDIASDKQVYVSPIDGISDTENFDFYMHDQSTVNPKADVVATVTQNKFYWNFSEVADGYAETNNKVTAEDLTSGTWKGNFDFEINMKAVDGDESHTHSYTETVIKRPTCTENGEKELTCDCKDTKTEVIPATGHKIESGSCTDCGAVVKTIEDLMAGDVSFDMGTILSVKEADTLKVNDTVIPDKTFTFDKEGDYQVTVETTDPDTNAPIIININITITINQGPEHIHNYTETIIENATCTEDGEKKLTCSCGDSKTEVIPAAGHNYENGNCTECGETEQCEHNYVSKTFNVDWVRDYDGVNGYKWVYESGTENSIRYKSNEPTGTVIQLGDSNPDSGTNAAVTIWKITVPVSCEVQIGFKPYSVVSSTGNAYSFVYLNNKQIWSNKKNTPYASWPNYEYKTVQLQKGDNYVKAVGFRNDCIELFKAEGECFECDRCSDILNNWIYTLDEADKTITLQKYNGSDTDVIVYGAYAIDGVTYRTRIAGNSKNSYTDYMFAGNQNVRTIQFESDIDTSETNNMACMFYKCASLTKVNLSNFDTSKATVIGNMFNGCTSLTSLDLSHFDTNNVTDMGNMFNGCTSLTDINLSSFNTDNVTNMGNMFNGCTSLTSLDLSHFDTGSVTFMGNMFNGCTSLLDINLSGFNTNNVTSMNSMFKNCSSLADIDLSSFDTNNVKYMNSMFNGCTSLETIYVTQSKWTTSTASTTDMFLNCGTSEVIYK